MSDIERESLLEYLQRQRDLVGLEPLIFEHCVARLKAELAWHDDVLDRLKETT